jgi:hypothetical protein
VELNQTDGTTEALGLLFKQKKKKKKKGTCELRTAEDVEYVFVM